VPSPQPVPRHPGKIEFWISQYEIVDMGFTRAEQASSR